MKLVICEKDLLARDIANAIAKGTFGRNDRFPVEGYTSGDWRIVAASGHLLELASPEVMDERYGSWRLEDLPIAFDNWPKVVSSGSERRVETIGAYLTQAQEVYHAGDPDDEGQLIVDEVLDYFGFKGPVRRVYVNDSIEKNIIRAFDEALDNETCRHAGNAAYARQMADAAFGYSESRLATIKLKPGHVVSLGRVQTPTLGRLVERDLEVEGHKSRSFFQVRAHGIIEKESVVLTLWPTEAARQGEPHIFNSAIAKEAAKEIETLQGDIHITHRIETAYPPLPYSLTALQADMSKRYGYTAKRTMEITQSLRDKYAAITYNRTDCQYLKEEHFTEAKAVVLTSLGNICSTLTPHLDFNLHSKCFNDANVSAHHAIIPQEVALDSAEAAMSPEEFKVYNAIVQRYAMQFLEPCLTNVAQGSLSSSFGELTYKATITQKEGWKAHFKDSKNEKPTENPYLDAGIYCIESLQAEIVEKTTTPPKRYTEGSLIVDMSRIAKYVQNKEVRRTLEEKDKDAKGEHGGIGTTATRHEIIDKLKQRGYAEVRGKHLVSTKLGRTFYSMLPKEISGVDTTARWCLIQQNIKEGTSDVNALTHSVIEIFNSHKESAYEGMTLGEPEVAVGVCPLCAQKVIKRKRIYSCTSNREEKQPDGSWKRTAGCGFKILPFSGHDLTEKEASDLLSKKRTTLIKGFISNKTKKTFDAVLTLQHDGSLKPVFPTRAKLPTTRSPTKLPSQTRSASRKNTKKRN